MQPYSDPVLPLSIFALPGPSRYAPARVELFEERVVVFHIALPALGR